MEFIKETKELLKLSMVQFADMFGISYEDLSDILEGRKDPTPKLLNGCRIARNIFLDKSNT